jgi:hypothetical protein
VVPVFLSPDSTLDVFFIVFFVFFVGAGESHVSYFFSCFGLDANMDIICIYVKPKHQ